MINNDATKQNTIGKFQPKVKTALKPLVFNRAPLSTDITELGRIFVNELTGSVHVLSDVTAGVATWPSISSGTGTFNSLIVTTTADIGTGLTVGTTLEVTGNTTLNTGIGVVQSTAGGLISSSAGTNGQLLVAATGGSPVWSAITSATLVLTPGAGTLNIEESGGTANSFVTDVGGPIAPLLGVTNILGGSNITTDGSVANTITFDLDDNVTVAGSLSAGDTLSMLSGTCTVSATDDVAQAIYLHADGGVNETIDVYCDQGTNVASINVHSDVGGVTVASGLASADAININASDAAGGIDIDFGTGGCSMVGADGAFLLETGTAAIDLGTDAFQKVLTLGNITGNTSVVVDCGTGGASFGASATAHTTTIGSLTAASSTVVRAGTGDLIMTSTDDITIDGAGLLELNSTAGAIGIGSDADNFALNLATAGTRTVTMGSAAATIAVDCGVGGATFGATASAHATTLGSTNTTSNTILQSGSGGTAITSTGAIDLDSTGVISINSTAGALNIGNDDDDFAVNIATTGERVVTIGNVVGVSQVVVNSGTAGIAMASTGAGDITIDSDDTLLLDSDGVLELNSSAGIIGIGSDADAFGINIGTGAAQRDIVIGNTVGTTSISLDAASGGIDINGAGLVTVTPVVDSQVGAATTVNANVGVSTHTGLTTGAGLSQVLTVTNSVCGIGSAILCTLSSVGVEDAQCTVDYVKPAAGSFTLKYTNNGAAALASNLLLTFWIIA